MAVLLTGETGTGKEVTARLIHAWSVRHDRRFVPINCAAIPDDLMEAELFGYARGAFSGAVQAYDGRTLPFTAERFDRDHAAQSPTPLYRFLAAGHRRAVPLRARQFTLSDKTVDPGPSMMEPGGFTYRP